MRPRETANEGRNRFEDGNELQNKANKNVKNRISFNIENEISFFFFLFLSFGFMSSLDFVYSLPFWVSVVSESFPTVFAAVGKYTVLLSLLHVC